MTPETISTKEVAELLGINIHALRKLMRITPPAMVKPWTQGGFKSQVKYKWSRHAVRDWFDEVSTYADRLSVAKEDPSTGLILRVSVEGDSYFEPVRLDAKRVRSSAKRYLKTIAQNLGGEAEVNQPIKITEDLKALVSTGFIDPVYLADEAGYPKGLKWNSVAGVRGTLIVVERSRLEWALKGVSKSNLPDLGSVGIVLGHWVDRDGRVAACR